MPKAEIQQLIIVFLQKHLQVNPATVETSATFDTYGVDSFLAVNMTAELSEFIGSELSPTLLYEHQTIESLSSHLNSIANAAKSI
jgi:acyl carrier protein